MQAEQLVQERLVDLSRTEVKGIPEMIREQNPNELAMT